MADAIRVTEGAITAVCWAMSIYKTRDLILGRRTPALLALCVAIVTITIALSTQPLADRIDRAVGVLDVTRISANSLTLVSAAAAQAFLILVTGTTRATLRQVRWRVLLMVGCVTTMIIMFVATPGRYRIDDPFVRSGAYYTNNPHPYTAGYTYIYLGYLGWSLAQVVVLAHRYARATPRPLLRLGLRLMMVGSVLGCGYVLLKVIYAVVGERAASPLILDHAIALTFTAAILLILIGSTLPSWGALIGLDRLWTNVYALHNYRRLLPLWRALRHAVLHDHPDQPTGTDVALLPELHGIASLRLLPEARVRLLRLIVEINDCAQLLAGYIPPDAEATARRIAHQHGLHGRELPAVIRATQLAAAVRARTRGASPTSGAQPATTLLANGQPIGEGDVTAEVTWLTGIAAAYTRSPVVTAALNELP
jgi:uncharacterized protein DUF6545